MNKLQRNRLYGNGYQNRKSRMEFVSFYTNGRLAFGLRVLEPVRQFKPVRRAKSNWRHVHRQLPRRLSEFF